MVWFWGTGWYHLYLLLQPPLSAICHWRKLVWDLIPAKQNWLDCSKQPSVLLLPQSFCGWSTLIRWLVYIGHILTRGDEFLNIFIAICIAIMIVQTNLLVYNLYFYCIQSSYIVPKEHILMDNRHNSWSQLSSLNPKARSVRSGTDGIVPWNPI